MTKTTALYTLRTSQFKPFNKLDAEKPKNKSKKSKRRQKTAAEELEQIRSAWYNYYRKLKVET